MDKKINVGCGMTLTKGWINYDNSLSIKLASLPLIASISKSLKLVKNAQLEFIEFARSNKIIWADVTKRIPEADSSVYVLYTSHMLEHLDKTSVKLFLSEARRVLRHGGIIRIAVPNLRIFIEQYLQNEDANAFMHSLLMNKDMPRTLFSKLRYLIVGDRNHQWMYDEKSLCDLLLSQGFSEVKSLKAGETTIENAGELNLREREEESLYVEAKLYKNVDSMS